MKPSPIGSKILSGYGIVFAGILPLIAAAFLLIKTGALFALIPIPLSAAVIYFGIRVFAGHKQSIRIFAVLVMMHYLGVAYTNYSNRDSFPSGSYTKKMTTPRIIRGFLFSGVFCWYYLLRQRTREQFEN
jgi:hypothetical protein